MHTEGLCLVGASYYNPRVVTSATLFLVRRTRFLLATMSKALQNGLNMVALDTLFKLTKSIYYFNGIAVNFMRGLYL